MNRDVFESLTPAHQKIVEIATAECHQWNLSQFLSENGAALQRLTAGGVTIREFPDSVWDAFGTASQEVYAENMGDDLFKSAFESVQKSMKSSSGWLTRSEGAYRTQRDRVLG